MDKHYKLEGAHESGYLRQALAFNAEKFRGHVTLATPPFGKIFGDNVRTVPGNTFVKFQAHSFNRFELFNAQKFRGSRDFGHAPFG